MQIDPNILLVLTTILMVVTLALSFLPILPGPLLPWAIGMVFGVLNGWERLTPAAALVMTALMLIGVTADWWRPLLGAKTTGMGCRTSLGSFAGGLIGTFIIPIPLIGTIIGLIVGALIVELAQFGDLRKAMTAGQAALKLFIVGYVLNIIISIAIFGVYLFSILST
ncbi:MAG: DUF456 domain-containing protein [Anaerolineae bacterium]|nr:DUF456 domain-containing protein [Anaerolineae bacterium]MBN8617504.1 DUF456 domain-containing protein [Anaerolineae bacterium]